MQTSHSFHASTTSDVVRSSTSSSVLFNSLGTTTKALYNFFTCKNLDLEHYRALLVLTFVLNIVSLVAEVLHMVVVFLDKNYISGSICLAATTLTVINCFLVLRLIIKPTTRAALASSAIILIIEVVYIIQTVVESQTLIRGVAALVVTIVLLVCHLCTAWLLYRYWEFAMYHYDDTRGLQSFINNFPDSVIQSSDVISQMRSPLVEDSRHSRVANR